MHIPTVASNGGAVSYERGPPLVAGFWCKRTTSSTRRGSSASKSSFPTAWICTTVRQIPASFSTKQGPATRELNGCWQDFGASAPRPLHVVGQARVLPPRHRGRPHRGTSSSVLLSSLELSDTKVYEPSIRARLGTASHFCKVVVHPIHRRARMEQLKSVLTFALRMKTLRPDSGLF